MTWAVRMAEIPRRSWTFFPFFRSFSRILKGGGTVSQPGYPILNFFRSDLMGKISEAHQIGGEQGRNFQNARASA